MVHFVNTYRQVLHFNINDLIKILLLFVKVNAGYLPFGLCIESSIGLITVTDANVLFVAPLPTANHFKI